MDVDSQVKLAIYKHFAETGTAPSAGQIAEQSDADVESVHRAFLRLQDQHVLTLEPDGTTIRMAPPFSGVPTQHTVVVDGKQYFANCAWDSLGIPAALQRPGAVRSRCEQSGEPFHLNIGADGPDASSWLFHSAVPASKWWDDIVFT